MQSLLFLWDCFSLSVGSTVGIFLLLCAFTVVMSCYSARSLVYQVTHGEDPRALSKVTISEEKEDLEKYTPHPGPHGWLEHQKYQTCLQHYYPGKIIASTAAPSPPARHLGTSRQPWGCSGGVAEVSIPTPHPQVQRAERKIKVSSCCHIYGALETGSLLREDGVQFPAHLNR